MASLGWLVLPTSSPVGCGLSLSNKLLIDIVKSKRIKTKKHWEKHNKLFTLLVKWNKIVHKITFLVETNATLYELLLPNLWKKKTIVFQEKNQQN